MLVPGGDTTRNQRLITLEVDQTDIGAITDEDIAVASLERRAGNDGTSTRGTRLVNPGGDRKAEFPNDCRPPIALREPRDAGCVALE